MVYVSFCAFASQIFAQKYTTTKTQLNWALGARDGDSFLLYPFHKSPFEYYLPALRKLRREELIAYKFLDSDDLPNEARTEWAKKYNALREEIKELIAQNQIEARETNVYLGEIELALEKLNQEFPKPEKPGDCPHEEQEIRLRRHANNSTHVVSQCLICGRAVKDHKKTETPDWDSLPSYEEGKRRKEEVLYNRWWELRNELVKKVIGEDGRLPEFDYIEFQKTYELDHPRPLSPSECNHSSTRITLRKYSETNIAVVLQCCACGKHVKNIPKKEVDGVGDLPEFDPDLEEEAWNKGSVWFKEFYSKYKQAKRKFEKELIEKIRSGEISRINKTTFGSYYESKEWEITRSQIFSRDEYKCQCCGVEAECVHHVLYDRLGRENDLDLISLCNECHCDVHAFQDGKWYGYRLTPVEIRDYKKVGR